MRSFVRREGRITPAQKKAVDALDRVYGIDPALGIDANYPFPRQTEVTLEIGFGDGDTLLSLAKANPAKGYLGIDPHRPGAGRLLLRLEKESISNVRVVIGDAAELIPSIIPNAYLTEALVLFPDPWPKKRHVKRRLIDTEFMSMLISKLKPGGHLHLATDWQEYAEQMLNVMNQVEGLETKPGGAQFSARPAWRPVTKYERRGLRLGHAVFDLCATRK